jgi:hypothetical protein
VRWRRLRRWSEDRRSIFRAHAARKSDRRFVAYGADPDYIAAMRERFAKWREELVPDGG